MRLRFHPAFRIPQDGPKGKINPSSPSFVPLEGGQFQVVAPAGLSMIEINVEGKYRTHFEFLENQPKTITLSMNDICARCKCTPKEKISLEAMSINQQHKTLDSLNEFLNSHDVRLPGVDGIAIKSDTFGGSSEGATKSMSIFMKDGKFKQAVRISVHHGSFLDGFIIHWNDGSKDTVGKTGGGRSDFDVIPGEKIQGIVLRCGAWIDGLQFKFSSGRLSPWYGGQGGSPVLVEAPQGYEMVGFYSTANSWMDQIGIYYRHC
jgi:hypothetical protein